MSPTQIMRIVMHAFDEGASGYTIRSEFQSVINAALGNNPIPPVADSYKVHAKMLYDMIQSTLKDSI